MKRDGDAYATELANAGREQQEYSTDRRFAPAPGYLHLCERQQIKSYTTLPMAEDRTSGKELTRTELLQKQKDGTLTQDEKILFLIKVRGMKASDAEAMIKHPPRNIITKDIIHLG